MTDRTCIIDGCESKHMARGWCSAHYQRWKKHGDPLGGKHFGLPCKIDGCSGPVVGWGWCEKHYNR